MALLAYTSPNGGGAFSFTDEAADDAYVAVAAKLLLLLLLLLLLFQLNAVVVSQGLSEVSRPFMFINISFVIYIHCFCALSFQIEDSVYNTSTFIWLQE